MNSGTLPSTACWRLRPENFCLSILVHAVIVAALALIPPSVRAEKPIQVMVYKRLELRNEPLVYWARAALPPISPETPVGGRSQFRGAEQSWKERVIVERPNADPAKQLIWQPDKPQPLQIETPLDNLVAVKGKTAPKPFEPPPIRPPAIEPPKSLPTPEARPQKPDAVSAPMAGLPGLPVAKPKPKAFLAPKEQPRLALQPGVVADAPPELTQTAGRNVTEMGNVLGSGALPRKAAPFVPPPGSQGGAAKGSKDLSAPPEVANRGTGSAVTAAVISLDPANKLPALPNGSRSASFSRAPTVGAPSGGTSGNPVIPGVAILGVREAAELAPLPSPPPVSGKTQSVNIRVSAGAATMSAPMRPAARILPREIEARFTARIVYTLVIPKPNLPEYAGDWTIWFAERTATSATASAIRAPFPIRKTVHLDKPAPAAAVPGTWVQVSAIIGKDGKVSGIAPVMGRSPVVAAQAAEDLANWEFRPAMRNGEPVEVEVVIEIPFRTR